MTRATLPGSFRNSTAKGVRIDTHRCTVVDITDTEMSNVIPLREELPKVPNFRSSSWTGRFPRTLSAAFGCSDSDPVYPMREPSSWQRLMAWLSGMSK
jgi:hypothetical protein